MGMLYEYSKEDQDRINGVVEKFNDVEPFAECTDICIEKDAENYSSNVGLLWMGSTWFTVAQARALRDWLNQALPS